MAILDLRLAEKLPENRIQLVPALLTRFQELFRAVARPPDTPNIHLPYFYMRSEFFWELHPASSQEGVPGGVGSLSEARERIAYASLDPAVWRELGDPGFVEEVAQVIMGHWFPDRLEEIRAAWTRSREVSQYEIALERQELGVAETFVPARDAAFRRLVIEGYDFRCAASGWRFMLDGWSLVEAAHIVPFSESYDDRPQNGIALTPSFHRLMDQRIIAPGPDLKWHVSRAVDRRIPDNRELVELDGTSVILPKDQKFHPDANALERRVEQLVLR